ncbi:MAG: aminotransferase class V-fold PLP-dependent enzyme [Chloroflexota bacterium]|nr:aminotransferase class V-fold PLP-dependent enzyme [Chloroflexota bacterium]
MTESRAALIQLIRDSLIGADEAVSGPFGLRRVTYADYTASGRSLSFIEDYLRDAVMPLYANTHTESSGTGLQTTRFREDARDIVRSALGGNKKDHALIFCGAGSTGAVDKLVAILNLRIPADLEDRYHLSQAIPAGERPVVFIGPFEHHSNELPWRESIADLVTIHEDADGHIDLAELERKLTEYADRPLKIGSFSAASNVTGIVSDTHAIASLLHRHGALSFWDFAAAAPYVEVEMSPLRDGDALDYKDAIFLSPHKLIGGPGTPGVLLIRRELLKNRVPAVVGGGTVAYVNSNTHVYLKDQEHREEGGTPAILESIRCGLVFQLKEQVGVPAIREREESFIHRAIARWQQHPNIEILGNPNAERLSIVSFVIRYGTTGQHLHHNFVVAVLNDLFGIQSRGGCSCAGPYGHRLLGIDYETSLKYESETRKGCDGIKPGWARVNFNYFIEEEVFDFICAAAEIVATDGWKLLPQYRFNPESGLWSHVRGAGEPPLSLNDISYTSGRMEYASHRHREPASRLADYLAEAKSTLAGPPRTDLPIDHPDLDAEFELLRWFPLPSEIGSAL